MAGTRRELGTGYVALPTPLQRDKDGSLSEVGLKSLNQSLLSITQSLNGGIRLGAVYDGTPADGTTQFTNASQALSRTRAGQLDAEWIDFKFITAATIYTIPHDLDRIPIFFIPLPQAAGAIVVAANIGSWTDTAFYAQCNTANALVRMLIF